jgi:hypothetical protein
MNQTASARQNADVLCMYQQPHRNAAEDGMAQEFYVNNKPVSECVHVAMRNAALNGDTPELPSPPGLSTGYVKSQVLHLRRKRRFRGHCSVGTKNGGVLRLSGCIWAHMVNRL